MTLSMTVKELAEIDAGAVHAALDRSSFMRSAAITRARLLESAADKKPRRKR